MRKEGYFSSGDFAQKAHVTKKTLRYYDEHNILKPSFVNENGARFYSFNDFAKLQQILFLKYLGFSLSDIKEMTVRTGDKGFWKDSLLMQTNLVAEQIEQLSLMQSSLSQALEEISQGRAIDWSRMLEQTNINEMEQKLKTQYLNSSNIEARIRLHEEYSDNEESWFSWLFRQCSFSEGESVLELGCGDASLWVENQKSIPSHLNLLLSDISSGLVRDAQKRLQPTSCSLRAEVMDAHHINGDDHSFNVVIANHMLFYCEDLEKVFSEIKRVLKPKGRLICSTYSSFHMKEITNLAKEFDDRISLSSEKLYEHFGKENGKALLSSFFSSVEWMQYEDSLLVDSPEPLISYVLSCHGNQNRYIVDRYHEFYDYVKKKTDKGFRITKDAGVFVAFV